MKLSKQATRVALTCATAYAARQISVRLATPPTIRANTLSFKEAKREIMRPFRKLAHRGAVGIAFVVAVALVITVPAGATGTLDQSQPSFGPGFFSAGNCGTASLAQTFTSGITGNLDQVDVGVWKSETSTSSALSLQIQAVSGGLPTATTLASESIPPSTLVTNPTLATFTSVPLSSPVPVTAGSQYAIVLLATNLPCFDGYWWLYVEGNAYSGGGALERFGDGAWFYLGNAGQDFAFKTYVATATPAQQLGELLTMVTGIGPGESLAAKVQAAQASLASGGIGAACAQLGALHNEVVTQRGNQLTTDQADAILAKVVSIQQELGCA